MKLKIKEINFSAGKPIAMISEEFARKSTIHVDDRLYIRKNGKFAIAVVDITKGVLKENEIIVSIEVAKKLELNKRDFVSCSIAQKPESTEVIFKKLNNNSLTKKEIKQIVQDIVDNLLTEAEIAYFISSVYKSGMSLEETISMIEAIVETGKKLNLKQKIISDKHSIGGVPGRTTPIIISICAAAGLVIPKTSSRAITSPSGTADAIEILCKVDFSMEEIKEIVKKTNACLVWGGALNLAPADDKLIQVEKIINLDPEPQLLASIISKKISVGAKYVVIDIPYGKNTKVNLKQAKILEKKFLKIAKHFNINLKCSLNKIEEPLGNGIGPYLEIKDVLDVLSRKDSCYKLEQRSLEIAGVLLELTKKAKPNQGIKLAKEILDSGNAYKKFKEIVKAQKGNINNKPETNVFSKIISSNKSGKIKNINIKALNNLARIAGCPINKQAGIYLHKHLNQKTKIKEKILTIYAETKPELEHALEYYNKTKPIEVR
jgi:AMP phosphorylase